MDEEWLSWVFRWWFGEDTAMPPEEASASVASARWNEALAYSRPIMYGRRDVESSAMAEERPGDPYATLTSVVGEQRIWSESPALRAKMRRFSMPTLSIQRTQRHPEVAEADRLRPALLDVTFHVSKQ